MNKLEQAARQALEALTDFFNTYPYMAKGYTEGAAAALREALEEVPKSVRKPLTDKEIQDVWCSAKDESNQHGPFWFARAIEKAHGIE